MNNVYVKLPRAYEVYSLCEIQSKTIAQSNSAALNSELPLDRLKLRRQTLILSHEPVSATRYVTLPSVAVHVATVVLRRGTAVVVVGVLLPALVVRNKTRVHIAGASR